MFYQKFSFSLLTLDSTTYNPLQVYFLKLIFVGVTLQCCVSFYRTAKGISRTYTHPLPFGLPSHSDHHSALSRVPRRHIIKMVNCDLECLNNLPKVMDTFCIKQAAPAFQRLKPQERRITGKSVHPLFSFLLTSCCNHHDIIQRSLPVCYFHF